MASLILLGFGLWWLGIAVLTTLHHAKQDLPFNLGWYWLSIGRIYTGNLNLAQQLNLAFLYAVGYAFCSHTDVVMEFGPTKTGTRFLSRSFVLFAVLKTYLEQQYK